MRDAMLGWLASSTLKPQKNTNSSAASAADTGFAGNQDQAHLDQGDHRHRSQEHGPQVAAPLQRKQRQAHDHERSQHGGKVHVPVLLLGRPACTSSAGIATHMASCTACSTKTPTSRRSRPGD